jgi:hypothetical protein
VWALTACPAAEVWTLADGPAALADTEPADDETEALALTAGVAFAPFGTPALTDADAEPATVVAFALTLTEVAETPAFTVTAVDVTDTLAETVPGVGTATGDLSGDGTKPLPAVGSAETLPAAGSAGTVGVREIPAMPAAPAVVAPIIVTSRMDSATKPILRPMTDIPFSWVIHLTMKLVCRQH